ncbi:RluA family pseudouridine synthase [Vibrio sp. Isolate30]|uniref:RluA family pseudouridine synthase n=1 Tax=Vibrio sp. Isolate30 TaxID=2908536 RepID=UPI001EFE9102|nr:RluA family pseudouridine synthase [Vibrio sp. Isolate30]MCG9629956.1 pseudouridine synthase [Vibrio sp. Isolate30]
MPQRLEQFTPLTSDSAARYTLPARFTFPYYYTPHETCELAMRDLQARLQKADVNKGSFGQLYAVLLTQDPSTGEVGYLAAHSGLTLDDTLVEPLSSIHFVPSAFDHAKFTQECSHLIEKLTEQAEQIASFEQHHNLAELHAKLESSKEVAANDIANFQKQIADNKAERDALRTTYESSIQQASDASLDSAQGSDLLKQLGVASSREKRDLKALRIQWKQTIAELQSNIATINATLHDKRQQHAELTAQLEEQRLSHYQFLNGNNQTKSLLELLNGKQALTGSGDCCLPKLLNFAFKHNLKPLALAEFWWGRPPRQEVRQHGNLYPVCQSRSFEILEYQLEGIELEDNPLIVNPAVGKQFDIVYEDNEIVVVNKPAEFLSVPGKFIEDSVYSRIKAHYPDATGPLIIHRLDMSTSGLLILALTAESNRHIQKQFIERTVEKRYTALLEGEIVGESGDISLPLRGDITDRPRQLVCHQHGKKAETHWQVVRRSEGKTKVHLYPRTGRTHQLRVHCAHPDGLGTPIAGDDLYGYKRDRLHLHAGYLKLVHPTTKEWIEFEVPSEF